MPNLLHLLLVSSLAYALSGQVEEPLTNIRELINENPLICNGKGFCGFDLRERRCKSGGCMKRGSDELGPFWANRGKRNPTFAPDRLMVEEPHWFLVGRQDENFMDLDPFFVTRGSRMRDRRDRGIADESPFYAARGKKSQNIYK